MGLDLEDMQRHQLLRDLGKQVKDLYEKLHLQHDLLRAQHEELRERRVSESPGLTRRISMRLDSISSWKYAPQPLKSVRSRALGQLPSIFSVCLATA